MWRELRCNCRCQNKRTQGSDVRAGGAGGRRQCGAAVRVPVGMPMRARLEAPRGRTASKHSRGSSERVEWEKEVSAAVVGPCLPVACVSCGALRFLFGSAMAVLRRFRASSEGFRTSTASREKGAVSGSAAVAVAVAERLGG